jgi:hypothetical protein
MAGGTEYARGLAHGVVGPARVIAFGTSVVAPPAAVMAGLVLVVSFAEGQRVGRPHQPAWAGTAEIIPLG